jgi:hypothetical protein
MPSLLDQSPEGGVVEIVDVAVNLSPTEIVSEVLNARIADGPAIKTRERCRQGIVGKER